MQSKKHRNSSNNKQLNNSNLDFPLQSVEFNDELEYKIQTTIENKYLNNINTKTDIINYNQIENSHEFINQNIDKLFLSNIDDNFTEEKKILDSLNIEQNTVTNSAIKKRKIYDVKKEAKITISNYNLIEKILKKVIRFERLKINKILDALGEPKALNILEVPTKTFIINGTTIEINKREAHKLISELPLKHIFKKTISRKNNKHHLPEHNITRIDQIFKDFHEKHKYCEIVRILNLNIIQALNEIYNNKTEFTQFKQDIIRTYKNKNFQYKYINIVENFIKNFEKILNTKYIERKKNSFK